MKLFENDNTIDDGEFSPLNFLESNDFDMLDFTVDIQEENNESTESSSIEMGKSRDNRQSEFGGNNSDNVQELDRGINTNLEGNSGRRYSRAGYGDSFSNSEISNRVSSSRQTIASVYNSSSDGHIRERPFENDSTASRELLLNDLQEGGLETNIQQLSNNSEQPGYGTLGLKQKKYIRSEIKELLSSKKDDEFTLEEKELLKLYEGGGGLNEKEASASEVLHAFYTPRNLIKKTWELVDSYAPNAVTVLEPSCGIGRFAENRPNNHFTLRELDETSSRISKILHPDAAVIQGAFQAQFFDENGISRLPDYVLPQYDIVIGNPPYGEYSGEWKGKGEGKDFSYIDEYFIAKGLESTKKGGILAFIMPSSFLKKNNNKLAELLSKDSTLIDAWRLPNGTFPTTKVGADIVIFKKNDSLLSKEEIEVNKNLLINDNYFKAHQEHILGEVTTKSGRFGEVEYIEIPDGKSIDNMLSLIKPNIDYIKPKIINKDVSIDTQEKLNNNVNYKTQDLSYIEKAYNNIKSPKETNSLENNSDFLKSYEIKLFDGNFDTLNRRTWRNSYGFDKSFYFDVATKSIAIGLKDVHNKTLIIAYVDSDGILTKNFDTDSDSYKNLSNTRKERLDSFFEYISNFTDKTFNNVQNIAVGFLGRKNNNLYFKDIEPLRSWDNYVYFYDSSTNTKIEMPTFKHVLNNRRIENIFLIQHDGEVTDIDLIYPNLSTLYSSEQNSDYFSKILEDDSVITLSSSDINIPEKVSIQNVSNFKSYLKDKKDRFILINKAHELNKTEMLKINGMTSLKELETISLNKHKYIMEERKNKIEKIKKENTLNAKQNHLLDGIFSHGFTADNIDFVSNNSVVRFESAKENKDTIIVSVDHVKAFEINRKEKFLHTYNNFYITTNFLNNVYDFFGNEIHIADLPYNENILSLNKLLSVDKSQFSNTKNTIGEKIATLIIESIKDGFTQKPANEELKKKYNLDFDSSVYTYTISSGSISKEFLVKPNGTHIKVFSSPKSIYPIFDFDKKSNILKLFQDSYSEGYCIKLENVFRNYLNNINVVKDITINNQHYVDTDGVTIKSLPTSRAYEPSKMHLMDNQEFANAYGKNWNSSERVFWEVTDYKGYVDLTKLSESNIQLLKNSENYVEEKDSVFIHKELYASGNIYKKLDLNEDNYKNGLLNEYSYTKNKNILQNAVPKMYTIKDINQSINSPFIENLQLNDGSTFKERFLQWATGYNLEESSNERNWISDFTISNINREDIPATISWQDICDYIDGVPLANIRDDDSSQIEKMNIRNQKLNDRKNAAETLFNRYLQTGLSKDEEILFVSSYNKAFNAIKAPDYSKLPLFVDGMNMFRKSEEFKLYEQQIKGISFLSNKGNGLLAYDVGVGKTAAGIVATVNQLQNGRCRKPLIVVPKSVIGKWESDIHELFPNIVVNNLGNLGVSSNGQARSFYNENHGLNIPDGTITLVTKDALNNLAWTKKTIDEDLFDDYADLLGVTENLNSNNNREKALAEEQIYKSAGCSSCVKDSNYILWENTGFDHITVDEAHAYKNLFKVPRPKKGDTNEFLAMGSGKPSGRALKMFNITQLIQKKNNNRNVFMLTATPFTNSALEVYSMLTYIARKELEQNNIKNLYDFCRQYAKTRFEQVVTEKGDVAYKSVMKEFGDLHSLQNIICQYMDKVDGEEADIIRPKKTTHAIHIKPTKLQSDIFDYAIENIMPYKLQLNEKGAPTLEAMGILRTAALSPALLNIDKLNKWSALTHKAHGIVIPPLEEVVDCSPKLKLVCDTIIKNWRKHPDAGQVIYMPEGTDAFPHIINYMVKQGIPKEVFASIDGSDSKIGGKPVKISKDDDTDDKRAKVANCFNDKNNPCKILIGSSAISEGMDLNGNSIALYNCMLGWNPTETIQVEGRIWRQGNEQGHVHIVYPLMDDSIDSLLYQKHYEKISRIDNIWSFKEGTMNVEDINPESMRFDLIKDPSKRAKIKIQQEVESINNKILMLDNQLKDFDQLSDSRIKYNEKLEQRKSDKELYIQRHAESILAGNPNRSEQEQTIGLERFDKAISDLQKQVDNIKKRYISFGMKNDIDEHNFAVNITNKKELLKKEILILISDENVQTVTNNFEEILRKENIEANEKRLVHPLSEDIEKLIVPMHIVEKEIRTERYNLRLSKAIKDGNIELQKQLTTNFENWKLKYEKKWGNSKQNVATIEKNKINENIKKQLISKENNNSFDIVNIVFQEATDYIPVFMPAISGYLFDNYIEDSNLTRIVNNKIISFKDNTVLFQNQNVNNSFSVRMQSILQDTDYSKGAILYVAKKLLTTMSQDDKICLTNIGKRLNVTNIEEATDFYTNIAKGKLILNPNILSTHNSLKEDNLRSY